MLKISDNEELFKAVAKTIGKTKKKYEKYMTEGQISEEDLRKVKKLQLTYESLQGIDKLSSLRYLSVYYDVHAAGDSYGETIGKLPQLKQLKIIGGSNMDIDLGSNSKLTDVIISGTNCRVSGIEELTSLTKGGKKLSFYAIGDVSVENLEELLSKVNKKNVKKISLPLLYFAQQKSKNPNFLQLISQNSSNIVFTSFGVNDSMTIPEVIEFDKEITKIKSVLSLNGRDELGKLIKCFQFVCENFSYDKRGLKKENQAGAKYKDRIRSSKEVLKNKKGICSSISNTFNYIIQSEGIKSLPAHGTVRGVGAHQLSKVYIGNNQWAFFDPTFGIGPHGSVDWRYFYMSKDTTDNYCELEPSERSYVSAEGILMPVLKEKIKETNLSRFDRNMKALSGNEQIMTIEKDNIKTKENEMERGI